LINQDVSDNMNDVSIVQWKSALRGFLAGSFISGSIANPYHIAIQIVLFVIGLLVLMDILLPAGKGMYGVTSVSAAVAGFIITLLFSMFGYSTYYLVFVIIVTVLVYINLFRFLFKKKEGKK